MMTNNLDSETEKYRIDSTSRWDVVINTLDGPIIMFVINLKGIKDVKKKLQIQERFKNMAAVPTEIWAFMDACERVKEEKESSCKILSVELKPA